MRMRRDERDLELGIAKDMKPQWAKILQNVKHDMQDVQKRMKTLKNLHAEHVTHRTGKTSSTLSQEEIQIEAHTAEIHRLFQLCKQNISLLEHKADSRQDDILLNNLKMKLVTELADLSKGFRMSQQHYLQGLRALKEKRKEMNAIDYALADSDEEEERAVDEMLDKIDKGFTEDQMEMLIQNERDVIRRDKELKEILKSIYELQELFKDFSALVVEQGTMLDRIDFNIERTQTYLKKGNKQLERAESYQKCSRWVICLIFLLVIVVIVAAVLALKLGFKYFPGILAFLL